MLLLTITLLAIGVVVLIAVLARRIESFWANLKRGVVIFRQPRRYLREVLAWQAAGWILRFASFWLFLDAFNIGGSLDSVMLVMSVQAITGALPFTPGGAGAQQALLVVALDGPTYAAVLAYSVGQQVAVTAWSLAIAFITLGVVFRAWDLRRLIREGRDGSRRRRADQSFAYSTRICLPSSFVPSRRSSATLACRSESSTNENRSSTLIEAISASGSRRPRSAPSAARPRRCRCGGRG